MKFYEDFTYTVHTCISLRLYMLYTINPVSMLAKQRAVFVSVGQFAKIHIVFLEKKMSRNQTHI